MRVGVLRQILQDLKSGETVVEEVPSPIAPKDYVLIRTTKTLVSVGTERMFIYFGKGN